MNIMEKLNDKIKRKLRAWLSIDNLDSRTSEIFRDLRQTKSEVQEIKKDRDLAASHFFIRQAKEFYNQSKPDKPFDRPDLKWYWPVVSDDELEESRKDNPE